MYMMIEKDLFSTQIFKTKFLLKLYVLISCVQKSSPGACKILCGCNVLLVPIQITPLGLPKRGSHPLRGGSKL